MRDFEDSCDSSAATGELIADGCTGDAVVDEGARVLLRGTKCGKVEIEAGCWGWGA